MNYENYQEQVLSLAEELNLQDPVKELLKECCAKLPWEQLGEGIIKLTAPDHAENARVQLLIDLAAYDSGNHMAELAVMLAAATHTRERYRAMNISDQIYLDTMGCFPRFLNETYQNTGEWKFDRGFWTWRQTAGYLFRLGELEFEYTKCFWNEIPYVSDGEMLISVHIPSDAKLTKENLINTYNKMEEFYREYANAICYYGNPNAVVCHTWLLSPSLLQFLKQESHIRNFASDYEILQKDYDNSGCLEWLFQGKTDLNALPENTGLQKKVKEYLLQGGVIGHGLGRLKKTCEFTENLL